MFSISTGNKLEAAKTEPARVPRRSRTLHLGLLPMNLVLLVEVGLVQRRAPASVLSPLDFWRHSLLIF